MGRRRRCGRAFVLGGAALGLVGSSGCGPYQYFSGTGVHDATAAEVAGQWENVEATRLTLRRDGTATFRYLDGQDFDFDDGWRVSGKGTWALTDDSDGQDVRVTMSARTEVRLRGTGTARDASTVGPPTTTYTWRFYVGRDERQEVELFFFYGDPDAGNTYMMRRTESSSASSGSVR